MSEHRRVLVTGAGGPLGVNFCRSLRASGLPLHLVGTDANRYHLPLSICDQTYLIPLAKEREGYQRALAEIAAAEAIEVIVPTHPVEVRAVAALRDRGALAGMKVALPRTEILEVCDDKGATQKRLQAAGLSVPRTIVLDDEAAVDRAFRELRESEDQPIWVRGSGAPGLGIGGAALPCRNRRVALAWIEHYDGFGRMAASEYLPGANQTWMALFSEGRLVASAARERLEYVLPHVSPSGITGAPAVSKTIRVPALDELGERAVRAVDTCPHGVYFVDFKERGAGEPMVTEINAGRCGTTVHFYTQAGYNFPKMLTELALEGGLEPEEEPRAVVEAEQYWVRTLDCGPALVRDADFDAYPRAGGRKP